MLYKAIVLDNSNFFSNGTIRVRIPAFYSKKMTWDLSENFPNAIEEGEEEDSRFSKDFEARILTSMGGGRNYGTFVMPQINSIGAVQFLGDNYRKAVWIGCLFEPVRNDSFEVEYTNIPSDDPESEGENSDGMLSEEENMDSAYEEALEKNIVIRTKTTSRDSQEDVDWQQVPTTNIISVGKKRVRLRHFSEEDGYDGTTPNKWQDFTISREEGKEKISFTVNNENDDKKTRITIDEDQINFTNENDDKKTRITIDKDQIKFTDKNEETVFSFDIENKRIDFHTEEEIKLESDKIVLQDNEHTAVRYEQLIDIIEKFENHVHISYGSGPTGPPVDTPGAPDIGNLITQLKNQLASENIKIE